MYFDELRKGMQVQTAPAAVSRQEMLAFSRQYDNVLLHTDEDYAKATHFGQLLAPGMLSFLLVWAKYLEQDFFGEQLLAGTSQRIEWSKPVFAEDILTGVAEITNLTDRSPRNGLAELTLRVYNQNQELVLTGVTECVVRKKSQI